MRLSAYLNQVLVERLSEHRIVVWYDGEQAFGGFVANLQAPNCRIVLAAGSELEARREAEAIYRPMDESPRPAEANANLLIYISHARANPEQRTQDPFEIFTAAGAVFGESESERLQSLARAAMPELVEQIDTLFLTGQPTFELIDQLKVTTAYPLLEQTLGTQSVVDTCVAVLGSEQAATRLDKTPGARGELFKLLESGIRFRAASRAKIGQAREQLARYILISELAFDLPGELPPALINLPRAELQHRDRIYQICDRLRSSDDSRDAYIALANRIQDELKLPDHFQGVTQLGERDTFAFEEQQYVAALTSFVQSGEIASARAIIDGRRKSVWRQLPARVQIWQVAERCLDLIQVAASITGIPDKLSALVEAYTRDGGWSDLDQRQRVMEQSWADCVECEAVQSIVEYARRRYRETIDRLQARFLKQVQSEGYPPEGLLRQTQIFDHLIAPALGRREKVVYVLADSLRFEMGHALAAELASLGQVKVQPAAAAIPTITVNGMAALMPGADGALALRHVGDTFVPYLGDRPLKDSDARMKLLSEKYGDRFADVPLSEWLDYGDKKRAALAGRADLLVVRVPDIDELGEHVSLRQARKHMSELLGDLKTTITQLARLGFNLIVIVADHGHVLLPEVLPGDVITPPAGEWGLSKRRAKLGQYSKEQAGSILFKASQLGIQSDAPDFSVPTGFSVYASDANYFHEGLSLPECIIPVVELRPQGRVTTGSKQQQIEIRYSRDRFTSQVIGLKVYYASLFGEPLRIRLEAYDAANPKSPRVGEAADCAARDENTHEITLQPNVETQVPLLVEPDFKGQAVEIRALAPDSELVWARLKLKNGILD